MTPAITHGELGKLRWHCRRGLLELDIILEQFNARHLTALDVGQLELFRELLAFPDNDLLDVIMGRAVADDARFEPLLKLLKAP